MAYSVRKSLNGNIAVSNTAIRKLSHFTNLFACNVADRSVLTIPETIKCASDHYLCALSSET
jgi:hypothetical protein